MTTRFIQSSAILLALASGAFAQQQPDKKPATVEKPAVVTVVYDIRDLLKSPVAESSTLVSPDKIGVPKPAFPVEGVGGGAGSNKPQPAATDPSDEIVKLIEDTVAPDTWRDSGGSIGVVRMVHGAMVVLQTPENQKLIQSVLSQVRQEMSRMVTVVARWVLLDSGQLEQLSQSLKQPDGSTIASINLAALEKLPGGAVKFRAQVTCFNGQTVKLSSGRAQQVVTGLIAVVGAGGAAYQPEAAMVQDGICLKLTPSLPQESATATIDIENVVSEWGGVAASPPAPTSQPMNMEAPGSLDRVDIQVQQLHTTIAVPIGKPILVGGMSLPTRADKDSPGRQMYLVIEVLGAK